MYYLLGSDACIEPILALSKDYHEDSEVSFQSMKKAYIKMLHTIQPTIFRDVDLKELYIYDQNKIDKLVGEFFKDSLLTDKEADIESVEQASSASIQDALKEVKKGFETLSSYDQMLGELAQLVFTTIFYAYSPSQGGGSTSNAVGVLWCSNRPNWDVTDLAEFIVHELAHQFMFLDEMKYGHYSSLADLADKDTFVHSTILNEKRPLDKVIHSLVVALEVLSFRLKCNLSTKEGSNLHPSNDRIIAKAQDTLKELDLLLNKKSHLVLPRCQDIIHQCSTLVFHLKKAAA